MPCCCTLAPPAALLFQQLTGACAGCRASGLAHPVDWQEEGPCRTPVVSVHYRQLAQPCSR